MRLVDDLLGRQSVTVDGSRQSRLSLSACGLAFTAATQRDRVTGALSDNQAVHLDKAARMV